MTLQLPNKMGTPKKLDMVHVLMGTEKDLRGHSEAQQKLRGYEKKKGSFN